MGIRAVHFLNQFFAGLGGEEAAGIEPQWIDGPRGPGTLLGSPGSAIDVVGTIAAGDNRMAEDLEAGTAAVLALMRAHADPLPDVVICGPGFNAGRYGMACGAIGCAVEQELGIPAVTALYEENPALEPYRAGMTVCRAGPDVMGMRDAMAAMAGAAGKRVRGEALDPELDDVFPRGLRMNVFSEQTGAERAIEMLLSKVNGDPPTTEYAMPSFDRVDPAPALDDPAAATVALVTSGGIVPRGNPDRIESASASRYGAYDIAGLERLDPATHQSVHGGYDPTFANADPNRVLPLDAARALERGGRLGRLHDVYFATVGNATAVAQAKRFGEQIAATLVNVGVQAVIFTST